MTEKKQMNKKTLLGVVGLAVVVALMAIIYAVFGPKGVAGTKEITIEVINSKKESVVYEVKTDAEFLRQAMEEADGLKFSGTESTYGLTVMTVNGETADYNVDGSYWAFYVNGNYCNNGIDSEPIADGDAFQIVYTVYVAQ